MYFVIQRPARWLVLRADVDGRIRRRLLTCCTRWRGKGGEAFLRKRFKERHIDWGLGAFRRYGLLAIIVPSMLPPPMPFKIFVLLAGVADVPPGDVRRRRS